ncbi:peptidase inhibitor family I36 protein [Streptomyces sp. NPDC052114]|uniref:peptidase inhibitor family I36 protein n=1 Tax=unclassified Streptomyces TaxID=2593676 RepID=UPI0034276392
MRIRKNLTIAAASLAVLGTLATSAEAAPASPEVTELQKQIDEQIRDYGGIQVSDNAVSYENGSVVMVFPDPGEETAPDGLGDGIRTAKAKRDDLLKNAQAPAAQGANVEGCPQGWTEAGRWYCFYEHKNFKGRRLQFNETERQYASNYGFNDKTSSWVNTNKKGSNTWYTWNHVDKNWRVSGFLWEMYAGSKSSYVGNAANDKMSAWCMPGKCI